MKGLMLHKGAELVSRDQLENVPTPAATTTHQPVSHAGLVKLVERGLAYENLNIVESSFGVTPDGNRLFGLMRLESENSEFGNIVGVRNSHDKKFPAGLCIGSKVFVCDNLAFSGQINVTRKHCPKIMQKLPGMVWEATARMGLEFDSQAKRIRAYKEVELSPMQTNDILVNLAENDSVVWRDIPKILKTYRGETHPEHRGNSMFSLWNAVTENAKGQPLETLCRRTQGLHATLDRIGGINVEDSPVITVD